MRFERTPASYALSEKFSKQKIHVFALHPVAGSKWSHPIATLRFLRKGGES